MRYKVKMIGLLLGLALLLPATSIPALAADGDEARRKQVVDMINKELGYNYYKTHNVDDLPLNLELWEEKKVLSYGEPYGDIKASPRTGQLEYRYLGQTKEGDEITNIDFPHDAWAGGYLEDRKWSYLKDIEDKRNRFDTTLSRDPKYLVMIRNGLLNYYGDVMRNERQDIGIKWQDYVHILQPPSDSARGLGRMWHITNDGRIWYITVPIAAKKDLWLPNLAVKNLDPGTGMTLAKADADKVLYGAQGENPDTGTVWRAEVGKTYTATVTFSVDEPTPAQRGNRASYLPSIEEMLPDNPAVGAAMHKIGSSWDRSAMIYDTGNGSIETTENILNIPNYSGHLQWVQFNAPAKEVTATFQWTARAGTSELTAVINYPYPTDDPLPYTWPIYLEGENGAQFDDNIITAKIQVVDPSALYPDLAVKSLDAGTAQTKPGETYTGKVVYSLNKAYPSSVTAKVGLVHNGNAVSGVDGKVVTIVPGEERSFNFMFTGQKKGSILEAKIWPVEPPNDLNWDNNSKKIIVPVKRTVDLAASLEKPKFEQDVGTTQTLKAELINFGDETATTTAVWRVNGRSMKTLNVSIPAGESVVTSFNFTMPDAASGTQVDVEIEVNPNKNKPSEERSWTNNKDTIPILSYKEEKSDSELGPGWFVK